MEKIKNDNEWPFQNTDILDNSHRSIESSFERLMKNAQKHSLMKMISDLVESNPNANLLDIGGQTGTLRSIYRELNFRENNIPYLSAAISLNDIRTNDQRKIDDYWNINLIEGDMRQPYVWYRLNNLIEKYNINGFDLIYSRMQGRLRHFKIRPIDDDNNFRLNNLIENAYRFLNINGSLIMQTGQYITNDIEPLNAYFCHLKNIKEINFISDDYINNEGKKIIFRSFLLTKTDLAPLNLP